LKGGRRFDTNHRWTVICRQLAELGATIIKGNPPHRELLAVDSNRNHLFGVC
jgi:hypothetical protein